MKKKKKYTFAEAMELIKKIGKEIEEIEKKVNQRLREKGLTTETKGNPHNAAA